jgi:hypothetical protein
MWAILTIFGRSFMTTRSLWRNVRNFYITGDPTSMITPEEANAWLHKFIVDEDSPGEVVTSKQSIPWQESPPTSWIEFLTLMSRFTEAMGWELDYDTAEDMALIIFGHEDSVTDSAEVQQGGFSFKEDKFPF